MAWCQVCGCALAGPGGTETAPGRAEAVGRTFFGIPPQGPLCRACLAAVTLAGNAVDESGGPAFCALCRLRLEQAWGSIQGLPSEPARRSLHPPVGDALPATAAGHGSPRAESSP